MKSCLLIAALLLLAACSTPEEEAAMKQKIAAQDAQTCRGYGFSTGTDAYKNCLMQVDLGRQRELYDLNSPPYPPYYIGGFPHYR